MTRTLADVRVEKKLSPPKTTTLKRDMVFNQTPETACTIPAGTKLDVHFSESNPNLVYFEYKGSLRVSRLINAHNTFTGFSKPPGERALETYADGISKTPTGYKTEPDGHGEDGSPSWLLVLGLM